MKNIFASIFILFSVFCNAQKNLDLSAYNKKSDVNVFIKENMLRVSWPTGKNESGKLLLDL